MDVYLALKMNHCNCLVVESHDDTACSYDALSRDCERELAIGNHTMVKTQRRDFSELGFEVVCVVLLGDFQSLML